MRGLLALAPHPHPKFSICYQEAVSYFGCFGDGNCLTRAFALFELAHVCNESWPTLVHPSRCQDGDIPRRVGVNFLTFSVHTVIGNFAIPLSPKMAKLVAGPLRAFLQSTQTPNGLTPVTSFHAFGETNPGTTVSCLEVTSLFGDLQK